VSDDQVSTDNVTHGGGGGDQGAATVPHWWLFRGTGTPIDPKVRDERWPPAPPWRSFAGSPLLPTPLPDGREAARRLGANPAPLLDPSHISQVNAALYLRRPLLVTGPPGAGKSGLAYLIAQELGLSPVLRWPVTSRTTARQGLYEYDAIGRAQAVVQARATQGPRWPRVRAEPDGDADRPGLALADALLGHYLQLGPLGTALLAHRVPRVLLIDEIDKSDYAFTNDLLNLFEDGEFVIPELARVARQAPEVEVHTADPGRVVTVRDGIVRCHAFPIVVMTSNQEREFSPAFLRRCTRLHLPDPDTARLAALVAAHFPAGSPDRAALIRRFEERRRLVGPLAADQLLNAAYLAGAGAADGDETAWHQLLDAIWHELAPAPGMW
jgi:MoxR-like ATPase